MTDPESLRRKVSDEEGRLARSDTEREVRIYDYVDRNASILARMFEKRIVGYNTFGYVSTPTAPGGRATRLPPGNSRDS